MTDLPPTHPEFPPPLPSEHTTRGSRLRTFLKVAAWAGAVLAMLLIGAGLLLTYWFPSEMVRQQLETRLSDLLQGTVQIESLSFNLLNGLTIRQAHLRREAHPPLKVERLQLDYSLWSLLWGTLRINEVMIEGADLVLNLPELSHGEPSKETGLPPQTDQPFMPALPVTVDVTTLKILRTHVQVIVAPDLEVRLKGMNLTCSGGISPETARLQGELDIKGLDLQFQEKNLQLPLMMAFDASIQLPSQQIAINHLTIQSEPTLRLTVDGLIQHPTSEKTVALTVRDTQIDLGQLLRLGHPFLPPDMAGILVKGTLTPQLTIKGSAPDGLFNGSLQGTVKGAGLEARLPSNGAEVGATDLTVNVNDLRIQQNTPTLGQLAIQGFVQQAAYHDYRVTHLQLGLSGDFLDAGPISGTMNVSGETTLPSTWLGKAIEIPFDVQMKGTGNYQSPQLTLSDLGADFGPYGYLEGTAAIEPRTPPSTSQDAAFDIRLFPRLETLLPLVPRTVLPGVTLTKGKSPDSIHVKAHGVLNQDSMPEAANFATAVKLGSLRVHLQEPASDGTLDTLAFLVSGDYQRRAGAVKGTAGLSAQVSNVNAPPQLTIPRTLITLKSDFQGHLSPAFQPLTLHSEDQLQVGLEGLTFTHPSMTASLPHLKWLSQTQQDVLQQHVIVKGLRVTAPQVFELGMKGEWDQPTQRFALEMRMPFLRLDQLLPQLSGSLMDGLQTIKPTGLINVNLHTAGSVPSEADITAMHLPLELTGTISVKDAGGEIAGFGIQDTNGTVSVNYEPASTPPLQFLTDLHLQTITFPNMMPIQQLPNTTIQIKIAAPSPDEIRIDQFRLTSNGLSTGLQGSLVGVQGLLNSPDPLGARLADLFAEVETTANVDLARFQEVLTPHGIQGTGHTGIHVHLRKKEHGNLDSAIDLTLKEVSLQQERATIEEGTGSIQIRKSLAWQPGGSPTGRSAPFHPSDLIAQLQRFAKTEHTFTAKRLRLGPLVLEDFSTNLHFDQQALKLQNISMNVLGGGLGGHVILSAGQPLRLSAWLEAAHLDLNQLVESAARMTGDSQVAATIGLTALLHEETGALDLSQSEFQLHITHIGQEALDRVLVFLDPQGSNPTLASARAQLKLANPSSVTIDIARGLLNLTIHFQGSLIPTFHLERVPLAKMKNLERLTAAIPDWDALSKIVNLVGAEGYSFTPEGQFVMQ